MHACECEGQRSTSVKLSSHMAQSPSAGFVDAHPCSLCHMWVLRILVLVLTLIHKRSSTQVVSPAHCGTVFALGDLADSAYVEPGAHAALFPAELDLLDPFYRLFLSRRWVVW